VRGVRIVENEIHDIIKFFLMDALPSSIPLRIDPDLQLTMLTSTLYQMFAKRIGPLYQTAKTRTLFEQLVQSPMKVAVNNDQVIVKFNWRAHNPTPRSVDYIGSQENIPWMHDRTLTPEYP